MPILLCMGLLHIPGFCNDGYQNQTSSSSQGQTWQDMVVKFNQWMASDLWQPWNEDKHIQRNVHNIEDIFEGSIFKLPSDIDKARNIIIEDKASNLMLGYTIGIARILAPTLEFLGNFLITERFLSDIIMDLKLWFYVGNRWFYAIAASLIRFFPTLFKEDPDPNLFCSSVDFFILLSSSSELSTNLRSITNGMSTGGMTIFVERLLVDFKSRLSCIVNKKADYSKAQEVDGDFERLLDLISLHHRLAGSGQHVNDKDALDAELVIIWDNLPAQIQIVLDTVTASRAKRSRAWLCNAVLRLLAALSGVGMELTREVVGVREGFSSFIDITYLYGVTGDVLPGALELADPGCGGQEDVAIIWNR